MRKPRKCKLILVVEDNPKIMQLVVDSLELTGYNVLTAFNEATLFTFLETVIPDLILLDIRLPGMGGTDVFKKIRQNVQFKKTKIVALAEKNIVNSDFDACIIKPIDTRNFVKRIRKLLEE